MTFSFHCASYVRLLAQTRGPIRGDAVCDSLRAGWRGGRDGGGGWDHPDGVGCGGTAPCGGMSHAGASLGPGGLVAHGGSAGRGHESVDVARLGAPIQRERSAGSVGPACGRCAAAVIGGTKAELVRWVRQGLDPAEHGMVRWRRADLVRAVETRFGVVAGRAQHERRAATAGFRRLMACPRHSGNDATAQASFSGSSPPA